MKEENFKHSWLHEILGSNTSKVVAFAYCSNSGNERAWSSSKSASLRIFCINCFMSLSDNVLCSPIKRSITCFKSLIPSISSPSKSEKKSNHDIFLTSKKLLRKIITEDSKSVFSFHGTWGSIAKYGHHIEEILECAIAIVTRTEHLTYLIAEWIHPQLRILKYFCHRKFSVFIVSNLFGC